MQKNELILVFSKERLTPYFKRFDGQEEKAIGLYKSNIKLSEACYTSLSILEIALRNAIHDKFSQYFKDEYWFLNHLDESLCNQSKDVANKILASNKEVTSGRIISELTFGFWTSLFNRKYANTLWKPLHRVFHQMPPEIRQRAVISPKLNAVRTFRNRIYHYEPVSWDLNELEKHYNNIYEILSWISPNLIIWTKQLDNFEIELKNAKKLFDNQ